MTTYCLVKYDDIWKPCIMTAIHYILKGTDIPEPRFGYFNKLVFIIITKSQYDAIDENKGVIDIDQQSRLINENKGVDQQSPMLVNVIQNKFVSPYIKKTVGNKRRCVDDDNNVDDNNDEGVNLLKCLRVIITPQLRECLSWEILSQELLRVSVSISAVTFRGETYIMNEAQGTTFVSVLQNTIANNPNFIEFHFNQVPGKVPGEGTDRFRLMFRAVGVARNYIFNPLHELHFPHKLAI